MGAPQLFQSPSPPLLNVREPSALRSLLVVSPVLGPVAGALIGAASESALAPLGIVGVSRSAGEGAGDHQVLQVPGQARRLGVGAELRDHRAQQPLVQAALHRQRQLRPHVSAGRRGAHPGSGSLLGPPPPPPPTPHFSLGLERRQLEPFPC